jgi:hypothetical protein
MKNIIFLFSFISSNSSRNVGHENTYEEKSINEYIKKRKQLLLMLLMVFTFLLSNVNVCGQNSLNSGDFSGGTWGSGQSMSASAGGSFIITKGVTTAGDKYFRFFGDGSPCGEYQPTTNGDFFTSGTIVTSPNGDCGSSKAWRINVPTTSSQVVFKTDGNNSGISQTVAFVVQGTIRFISSFNPISSSVVPGGTASIAVNLDGSLSTGQAVWLRYSTTSNYSSSTCVKMSGSGSSYSATIPAGTNTAGTTVYYYAFTSGDVTSITGANADFMSINLLAGSQYTVASNFYSKSAGSTALQTASNWGTATDGSGTAPVDFAQNGVTYNIRNSATATIGASWSVSGASSKIVVGDGTNVCNFTVPSTFVVTSPNIDVSNAGTITRTSNVASPFVVSGIFRVLAGGTYVHSFATGTLPAISWASTSNLNIDATLATNEFAGKTFGNVTINGSAGVTMFTSTSSNGSATIAGNLTVNSTGNVIVSNQSGFDATLTINGNLTISSTNGNFYLESVVATGTNTKRVLVNGNYIHSSGTIDLGFNTSSFITANTRKGILEIKGDFTHTGGNITESATDIDYIAQILLSKTSGSQNIESVGNATGIIEFNVAGSNAQCVVAATKTFVQSGGSSTFVVANGSSSVDLNILGTFRRTSTNAMTINASAVAQCGAGGIYEHAVDGGTVPTFTWNSNSTFLVTGITSSLAFTAGAVQSYGNVTWNCTSQTSIFSFGGLTTINGTLSVQSTGASPSTTSCLLLTNSGTLTSSVSGNLSITGGYFAPFGAGTSGNCALNISGNLYLATGTFDVFRQAASTANINLLGDFSMSSGTLTKAGAGTANFNFAKSGTQAYSKSGGTIANAINFTVNNGSTLDMGTSVLDGSAGTFTLSSGGGLITANTEGITSTDATGSIQVISTRTYNTGANYTFNGSLAQATGAGFTGAANLTINNSAGVTLTSNASLSGTLTLTNGAFAVGSSNTITVANGGSISAASGSLAAGTAAGTFTFSGAGIVTGIVGFNNVNIAGGVNFGTSSTINGVLSITTGGFVNTNAPFYASGSTLRYNTTGIYGRSTEWSTTSGAGYPNNVQVSNNTTLNVRNGSDVARQIAGNLTVDSGSALSFEGMTIASPTDIGLTVVGNVVNNGTITLATSTERLKCVDFTNNTGATTTLSSNVGGDLELTGSLIDNASFNSNNRAIFFTGIGVQDVSGTGTFNIDYIVSNKASGSIRMLTNLLVEGPNGGNAMTLTNSSDVLNLNGFSITLGKATVACTILCNGSIRGSSSSSMSILGVGALGTIRFDQTTPGTTNALNNFIVNRTSSGSVVLANPIAVSNTLTITNGNLNLGTNRHTANTLTLGTTAQITGSSYGGTSSPAENINTTYFAPTSGYVNVGNCTIYSLTSTSATACLGNAATVTLTNSTTSELPIGTYAVLYTLSGANTGSGVGTMVVTSAGIGTFATTNITNNGTTTVTINFIRNGCVSEISNNNTATISINAFQTASVIIAASATTICAGTSVTFTATPTNGGISPSYQWYIGATPVGTNSTTYTTTTLANADSVSVVLTSNATPCLAGSPATSNSISITVNPTLNASVSIGATATTICSGTSVTFTAMPTNGGSTPSYQWKVNGSNVGTDSATYTSTTLANGNTVTVEMTSNASPCLTGSPATSNTVTMTVNASPSASIVSNNGPSICSGSDTVFTISGTTSDVITYNLNGGSNTTATLTGSSTNIIVIGVTTALTFNLVSVSNGTCSASIGTSSSVTLETTTWNGFIWDNGLPNSSKAVVFTGDYTMTSDFSACSISISNNAVVIIDSGKNVSLYGAVTVSSGSSFILNNNSNLYQSDASAVNTGNIIVRRDSNPLIRLDYTMWSSPVAGQKLLAFSPLTSMSPTIRFYTYNTTTNFYNSVASPSTTDFATGKGYLIRLPYNHPTVATVWNGAFTGVPNNGTKTVTLTNIDETHQYNAVGNPYPSPISISQFASDNASNIEPTIYFWRKTNNAANPSYCTWNSASQTFGSNGEFYSTSPNGIIHTGQGFIVEAKGSATSLVFNNGQRVVNNTNHFLKSSNTIATSTTESHRIWLNLTGAATEYSQAVVGYFTNATQGADDYDSKLFNDGSIALSTKIGTSDYVIQGRPAPFDASDVVPLNFKVTAAGTYTFAIDHVDGLFTAAAQEIYIKDNLDGSYHNITTTPYSFASAAGTFSNRFELVYQNLLSSNQTSFTPNSIVVYRQQNDVVINTGSTSMSTVRIYDIRGRLLMEKKDVNTSETKVNAGTTNQVLLVQVTTTEGLKATKKVVN